jgi:DNA polymerase III alpha subunit
VGRHASGVVIGDDLPAETSLFLSKGIVQASFTDGIVNKSASATGLVKFDILSLASLEVISQACKNIAVDHPRVEIELVDGSIRSLLPFERVKTQRGSIQASELTEEDELIEDTAL